MRALVVAALVSLVACASKPLPDPRPKTLAPALICDAQRPATLTITGTGLDGHPLVQFDAAHIDYDAAADDVTSVSATTLEVIVPVGSLEPTAAADTPIVYDFDAQAAPGTLTEYGSIYGALTVVPPPELDEVTASGGALALTGDGFRDGMTVVVQASPPVTATNVVVTGTTAATATADLSTLAPGSYDVTVTNTDGCTETDSLGLTLD